MAQTEQEQLARELIQLRYENETAFSSKIKDRLSVVFKRLCSIGYSGSYTPFDFQFNKLNSRYEVDMAIMEFSEWLFEQETEISQSMIDSIADTYDVEIPFEAKDIINEKSFGHTTKERNRIYVNRFKYEAEAWIASAIALGMLSSELANHFSMYMTKPYSNPVFSRASALGGFKSTRLRSHGISFGVGRYVSAVSSLTRLARATVANAFRSAQWSAFNSIGAVGFEVFRGSSYPCSLCDSMVGRHPLDFAELPPYHNNCVCYAVPVIS